jgi:hypothetical protein
MTLCARDVETPFLSGGGIKVTKDLVTGKQYSKEYFNSVD